MKNLKNMGLLVLLVLGAWLYRQYNKPSQPTEEKVLNIVHRLGVKGIDPARAEDHPSACEIARVYEGLLEYHYLKQPYELVPNLAAAMPTISPNGLVYTFKIRQGVKFHDDPCFPNGQGRELVAEDFVFAIKRVADPQVQSAGFSMFADKIKGLDAWRKQCMDAPADYAALIEGLKALDPYTLQFTLTKPFPQFLYVLAMHFCYAVPQEAVAYYGPEFMNHPVGTGPFLLKEFKPQANKLVYHRNPHFRQKLFPKDASQQFEHLLKDYAGKPLPFVDKLVVHIIPEQQPCQLKFYKGQIDYIGLGKDDYNAVLTTENELTPAMKAKGIHLAHGPSLSTYYIVFNHALPLLGNNLKLRRAMSLAYDRETMNKLFYNNTSLLAQSILPPGLAGYQADYVNPYGAYDVSKAKQLLAEAGYPGGQGLPVITLDTPNTTRFRQLSEHFARCMQAIGIKVKVVPNPWPELLRKVNKKACMLHASAWVADYPDALQMLQLFYGPNKNSSFNGSNFDNQAYNVLYERASVMADSPARTQLYEQMNQMAAEQVPMIYTVHKTVHILHHSWLKNYILTDFDSYGQDQYLDVDMQEKQAMQAQL